MHDGCSGRFITGKEVLMKVRMMGFSNGYMPLPLSIQCQCGEEMVMSTFEDKCPHCGMVYAVTPCHAFDPANIMACGKDN